MAWEHCGIIWPPELEMTGLYNSSPTSSITPNPPLSKNKDWIAATVNPQQPQILALAADGTIQ